MRSRLGASPRLTLPVLLASAAFLAGCGGAVGGGSANQIKDPPPAPAGEMSSDDYVKQQSKAKGGVRAGSPGRR